MPSGAPGSGSVQVGENAIGLRAVRRDIEDLRVAAYFQTSRSHGTACRNESLKREIS
jgi:hypothetical protein